MDRTNDDFSRTSSQLIAQPSVTEPGKAQSAEERKLQLKQQDILKDNVSMKHVPTGEVTTFHRDALKGEKLFVPALRDSFPLDQFEEVAPSV